MLWSNIQTFVLQLMYDINVSDCFKNYLSLENLHQIWNLYLLTIHDDLPASSPWSTEHSMVALNLLNVHHLTFCEGWLVARWCLFHVLQWTGPCTLLEKRTVGSWAYRQRSWPTIKCLNRWLTSSIGLSRWPVEEGTQWHLQVGEHLALLSCLFFSVKTKCFACLLLQRTRCIHLAWVSSDNSVTAPSYSSLDCPEWLSISGGAELNMLHVERTILRWLLV